MLSIICHVFVSCFWPKIICSLFQCKYLIPFEFGTKPGEKTFRSSVLIFVIKKSQHFIELKSGEYWSLFTLTE